MLFLNSSSVSLFQMTAVNLLIQSKRNKLFRMYEKEKNLLPSELELLITRKIVLLKSRIRKFSLTENFFHAFMIQRRATRM